MYFDINEISKKFGYSDLSKLERQNTLFEMWKAGDAERAIKKGRSTIIAKTAFGKSVIGLLALKENEEKGRKGIIVVPTKALKKDWEEKVLKWNLNSDVFVINTAVKKKEIAQLHTDLLLLDEVHLFGRGAVFSKIFDINYKFIMGLTATLPEDDVDYYKLLLHAPVIATVGWNEVLENNYISDFEVIKIPVFATPRECFQMDRWRSDYWKGISIVKSFDNARRILSEKSFRNQYAYEHDIEEGPLFMSAKKIMTSIQKRQEFFYNHERKIDYALQLCNSNPDKNIITFGQRNKTVDILTEKLGDIAGSYHSGQSDKENDAVLQNFKHHRGKIHVINTAMALNQGVDIPKIDMGIMLSWTSSSISWTQRLGRVARLCKGKSKATMYVLPITRKDGIETQDQKWLTKAMSDIPTNKVKIINSLNDAL